MSTLTPDTPVHWAGADGTQQGPEPAQAVVARIQSGELPPTTQLWWPEASGWTPADQVPELAALLGAPTSDGPGGEPSGAGGATDALMDGLTDQQLDDEFIGLIDRSWEMYKQTELAVSIDETMLGGIIAALVDSGFVLIDLETAGAAPLVTTTTTTSTTATAATDAAPPAVGGVAPGAGHHLRFEEPSSGARVTIDIEHLTPDVGSASVTGHRAIAEIGYGERVPNASQVTQALRQEVASAFVVSPEPGTVSFDADISSGYVYAQIDLILEPERYVSEKLEVDHDLLRRHIAAVVYTMRTFIRTRFAG